MKKSLVKRALPSVYAAGLITGVVVVLRGILVADTAAQRLAILSDGFYLSGIFLISAFLMRMINRQGAFDMVAYNLRLIFPMGQEKYQAFLKKDGYTYMQEKCEARRKKDKGYPSLVVGLVCLGLATLFLMLYTKVS